MEHHRWPIRLNALSKLDLSIIGGKTMNFINIRAEARGDIGIFKRGHGPAKLWKKKVCPVGVSKNFPPPPPQTGAPLRLYKTRTTLHVNRNAMVVSMEVEGNKVSQDGVPAKEKNGCSARRRH